jgi:HPt (histidine-containing phosphotransfer) domain-containing protein
MTGFVAKPIRKEVLLAALLTALDAARPGASGVSAPVEMDQAEGALDHAAFECLKEALGTDGVAELVRLFEAETRARLTQIANHGLDRGTLIREVHSLKGTAAAACAMALFRRACEIEKGLTDGEMSDHVDVAPLTRAFEAWRAAVHTSSPTEALAA